MRIITAGESHGRGLYAIIEGLPAGGKVDVEKIDAELKRRSGGIGRGARQKHECDRVQFLSGILGGVTTGSPVTLAIENRDYANWEKVFSGEESRPLTCPRPGHADFAGMQKFGTTDARGVSERASARATAMRMAVGALCRQYLEALGIFVTGFVRSVGAVSDTGEYSFGEIVKDRGELFMLKREAEAKEEILRAQAEGDTLGGVIELRAKGLKAGFGSCMQDTDKLDARIAAQLMSVQAIKGVEFGDGFLLSALRGHEAHDEIMKSGNSFVRASNHAGGIEGGMSNGEEIVVRAAMKPLPTLRKGLRTVDLQTGKPASGAAERADTCAVAACEVVLENVLAAELLGAVLDRLGGETLSLLKERYERI